jgi:hypothetical protein
VKQGLLAEKIAALEEVRANAEQQLAEQTEQFQGEKEAALEAAHADKEELLGQAESVLEQYNAKISADKVQELQAQQVLLHSEYSAETEAALSQQRVDLMAEQQEALEAASAERSRAEAAKAGMVQQLRGERDAALASVGQLEAAKAAAVRSYEEEKAWWVRQELEPQVTVSNSAIPAAKPPGLKVDHRTSTSTTKGVFGDNSVNLARKASEA